MIPRGMGIRKFIKLIKGKIKDDNVADFSVKTFQNYIKEIALAKNGINMTSQLSPSNDLF